MLLNRYLVQEIALNFLATLLILTLIIVGNTFVRLLAEAGTGDLPVDLLGSLLWYGSLKNLIRLLPIALLIGMMLAFSRLNRDSEMTALRAAGFSPARFYHAIAWFVIPLTILLAFLVLQVSPTIEAYSDAVRRDMQQRPEAAGIPAGQFMTSGNEERNYTILAENLSKDNTVMERFFMRLKDGNKEILIWARSAILFIDSLNGERFLQILNGYRYENDPKQGMSVASFVEHGIRIPLRSFAASHNIQAVPTKELFIINNKTAQAELHWRIAIVLSAPLLAFLAFPLSYAAPRQGRYGKVAWAIVIYGVYASLLMSAKGMINDGKLSNVVGMWWIHALLLLLALWLLRRHYGKLRS